MSLDPDPETMRLLGYRAVDLAVEWLAGLGDARVARMPDPAVLRSLVAEPLPRMPGSPAASMERFMRDFMPFATLVNHPRFFAYIPCPGSYLGALGSFLSAATNLFTGTWLGGAVAAQLEEQVLAWLCEAMELPGGFTGILTSGGSMANLGAIATALAATGRAHAVLYASEETHHSVAKAARILGLAGEQVRTLPVDPQGRLVAATAAAAIAADRAAGRVPALLVATLGTTTTGAIDPLADLGALCRQEGVWFHVDGAYGAAVALLPEWREVTAPLATADSITLDPHKWLYTPFECGCLLTRHRDALHAAFAAEGHYMQDIPKDEINMYQRGPELSRGNRALKLWLLLRSVGIDAIADAIREDLRLARLARELLAADPRIELVGAAPLSIVCFRVEGGEAAGTRLMRAVLDDGFLMLSSSRVQGGYVLRLCVQNHRTTEADVRASVERIRELLA